MPVYYFLLLFTLFFPLIWSFESKIQYAKKWPVLAPAILLPAAVFLVWDVLFTKIGVWGFNKDYLGAVSFYNLPLEEWLFFIVIPFSCVFIYECVRVFIPHLQSGSMIRMLTAIIGMLILIIALWNYEKYYTFYCLFPSGLALIVLAWRSPSWLGYFWAAYFFHLIPFAIVNGVLTGSFLDEPIVWYNNQENLGIRLWTIPVEDAVYSLLLLLCNVTLFEFFKQKQSNKTVIQRVVSS